MKTRLLVFAGLLLSACTSYEALPLAEKANWATRLPDSVDMSKPVTMQQVVGLTLQLNPDLKTARLGSVLADAQVTQAEILPNPQFNGSYGYLLSGPGMFAAFGMALSQDIKALILRGAARDSAEYEAKRVDADLLWQEWQTITKAQLLYVDLVQMRKQLDLLAQNQKLFSDRYGKSHAALLRGDIDLTLAAPDLTALNDIDRQVHDLEKQIQAKWQELDALLALEPTVRFTLADGLSIQAIDEASLLQNLSHLPETRPDLLALRYGYLSQEEKLYGAILGQFPALVFGGNYNTDTSHVYTGGPTVTFDLPIFNRNQGNIAIEQATRQKLHDEYANRLNAADGEVKSLLAARKLLQQQLHESKRRAAEADTAVLHAEKAMTTGDIDERSYIDFKTAQLLQKQQVMMLEQNLLVQQIALASLIGAGMPQLKPVSAEVQP